jgi:hypothetical protein
VVRDEVAGLGVELDHAAVAGNVFGAEDFPGLADEEAGGGGGGDGFEPLAGLGRGEEVVEEDGVAETVQVCDGGVIAALAGMCELRGSNVVGGVGAYGPSKPRSAFHQISLGGMKPRASSGFDAKVRVILVGFQISLATKSAKGCFVMASTAKLRMGNAMLE